MRHLLVLALLCASCATPRSQPPRASPDPARPETVMLTLAWPDESTWNATLEARERRGERHTFTKLRAVEHLRRHDFGWVAHEDIAEVVETNDPAVDVLVRLSPIHLRIGLAGEWLGFHEPDVLKQRLRGLFPPNLGADADARLEHVLEVLDRAAARGNHQELERWVGAQLEPGREYECLETMTTDDGAQVPVRVTYGLERWVPCTEGAASNDCVRLHSTQVVATEDVERAVAANELREVAALRPGERVAAGVLIDDRRIVTEPATLLHRLVEKTRTLRLDIVAEDGSTRVAERVRFSRTTSPRAR